MRKGHSACPQTREHFGGRLGPCVPILSPRNDATLSILRDKYPFEDTHEIRDVLEKMADVVQRQPLGKPCVLELERPFDPESIRTTVTSAFASAVRASRDALSSAWAVAAPVSTLLPLASKLE